jgi:hypothetical protein
VPIATLGFFAKNALGPLLENVRRYEKTLALLLVVAVASLLGARRAACRPLARAGWADLRAVVPFLVGGGVINLLSATWPREPVVVREVGSGFFGCRSAAAR